MPRSPVSAARRIPFRPLSSECLGKLAERVVSPRPVWPSSAGVLLTLLLVASPGRPAAAQVYPSWVPTMPGSPTSSVFLPLAGWPRPAGPWGSADPGQRPVGDPFVRQSGVFGFVDTMGTASPNDDREYFIACRGDGIHIIDATPRSGVFGGVAWSASASKVVLPASNPVEWIEETDWSYLLAGHPSYPGRPVPVGFPVAPQLPLSMNFAIDQLANGWNGTTYLQANSYAPSHPVFPYPYTTKNATNREAVAWYDSASDKWFLYSTNTRRHGIWVIPLRRNPTGGNLQPDPTSPSYWWDGSSASPPVSPLLEHQHSIYIDSSRSQIWVCDDGQRRVRGIQILAGGALSGTLVLDYALPLFTGNPHDAMPVGDRLFVVSAGSPDVRVFRLPIASATPTVLSSMLSPPSSGHSCYFDATGGAAAFWFVQEQAGTPAFPSTGRNFERFAYVLGIGAAPDSWSSQATTTHIVPVGFVSTNSDIVHHIRGIGRTGYLANYNDGVSLASLVPTGSGAQPIVLGSYDTSPRSRPVAGSQAQQLLDQYDGCWDVHPGAPSGVLYASGGDVGALAFLIQQGHINRYWNATLFPAGAAAEGMYPRIASPYGPARFGSSYLIEDASAAHYPSANSAGEPVTYRHTLFYSGGDPLAPTLAWVPPQVTVTPLTNSGELNLDPNDPANPLIAFQNSPGKSTFFFPSLGATGQLWFAQLVVEELVHGVATGRWAASRGAWIGVAP